MKILMMRPSYRPEISGGTHLAIDLVEDFIAAGHEIEVVTPISLQYKALVDEEKDECKVHRVTSNYSGRNVFLRVLRYIDVSRKMYKEAVKINADVIMTHSMPPLLGFLGAKLAAKKKVPVVYWEQDIVSESLISTSLLGRRGIKQKLAYNVAKLLEKKAAQGSDHIVTISRLFKDMHIKGGMSPEKISVVYNWIDVDQIYPIERKSNPLFDELDIPRDKFIVSYCGNLGVPQNVEIMIDAAEKMQNFSDILFVIIGGGSREDFIKKYVDEKKIKNVMLFPLQPLEKAKYVYSLGNVGLVIGRSGTSRNGFPSKTWSIMAAGQAIVACFDQDSELSEFVREGNCGLTVEPDSSTLLVEAIQKLYSNEEVTKKLGENARRYVEERFNRSASTKEIIRVVESVTEIERK